jgi:hypothetical protein
MYPRRELTRLAARKVALRHDIALRRAQCVAAATRLAQPLAWFDRLAAFTRRLAPVALCATIPLGLFVQRAISPQRKILGRLAGWGPLAFALVRRLTRRS